MTSESAKRADQGFSVIELLIVMTIVGIAMLPLAGVQFGSRQDVVEASRHGQAIDIATSQLESMRAQGFGVPVDDNGVIGNITWTSQVINVNAGLDEYRVTVTWQDGADQRTMTLSTLQAQRR